VPLLDGATLANAPSGRASVERSRASLEIHGDDHVDSAYEWSEGDYLLHVLHGRYAEAFRIPATATSALSNGNDFRT
jgi:hypothetical protein